MANPKQRDSEAKPLPSSVRWSQDQVETTPLFCGSQAHSPVQDYFTPETTQAIDATSTKRVPPARAEFVKSAPLPLWLSARSRVNPGRYIPIRRTTRRLSLEKIFPANDPVMLALACSNFLQNEAYGTKPGLSSRHQA